jgi:hypothetical protein
MQSHGIRDKSIQSVWCDGEWYFTIVDVIAACSDSKDPSRYPSRRDPELAKGWGQIATPLKVPTKGGIAGKALDIFEKESGMKVVSENNFLEEDKKARKKLSAFRKKKKKDDDAD